MDEARNVLARLERIDDLQALGAPPGALLAEVRVLLAEAEEWLDVEPVGTRRAAAAVARSRAVLAARSRAALAKEREAAMM